MNAWERLTGHDPAAPAVHSAEGVTGYGELAALVDRCAAVLRALGLAPGEVLAVEVDEGLPAVIALVAALRAEVPFVWLNPTHPPVRREQVVGDCRPAALLTWEAGGPVARRLGGRPAAVPADTGCVVYTSGSTGTPKGIVQPRANLDQFARWFAAELALAPGSRVLQWAVMSYDAAYAEVLAALHAGATLVVPSAGEKSDPARIAALVAEQRVSHLLTVPSLCRALFTARADRPLPEVRSLGLFGEVLPPDLLTAAARYLPDAEVRNFYGPTECTLATWYRVPAGFTGEVVPVGRPIPGREVLLDGTGTGTGTGTGVGEVLVRSRYLAHGYLGREDETAQRFLADPGGDPAVRVYRTGDLGRYDAAGELVFVGRLDDEVKIRGVRVRLGDVEAALSTAPGVAEVAVRLHGAGRVAPGIAAYVVAHPDRRPEVTALRRHAVRVLPPVMVPAHYVLLDDLPRTSTGKVDRAALPPPVRAPLGRPPSGELERELAGIWRDTTGCAEIGVDDDFFGVGGYSLLAPDVVARVRTRLGLAVPRRAVFDHSRFGDFAAYLTTLRVPTKEQP
ncbi:non-ribosomal peptide synthetase [Saccharothrix syringae]|uniref:non-ribosomal peptide synthetase n=1 Tax=Saccharothrix syringae TaxID=103733 RepID=UPI00068A3BAA|nr:non-ribosomal peptide synthetase [Saccharothrix syringae]